MCGIAGIIYRNGDGAHRIGRDMTRMLQSMKHRGPDSTGYALYRAPTHDLVLRVKLADASDLDDLDGAADVRRRRREVEARVKAAGAQILKIEDVNAYTITATLAYDGDLKWLADHVESVPHVEVLSLGHALEIIKDLGDANTVGGAYRLEDYFGSHGIGHVRMATESDVDISNAHPYWAYPFSDVAVVHNGQLTNYHQWRRRLEAGGPPVRVGLRLGDHRRLPRRADEPGRLARGRDAPQPRGARRRVHLHLRLRGRARHGQGRARRQAAGALRGRRHGRARLRGDRDPRGHRPARSRPTTRTRAR